MELGRRAFLKVAAATTAGVAAGRGGSALGDALQASALDERVPGGVERWVTTGCTLCSGGCGARVRVVETRAVKLEGNPFHPVTGGGLCPVGQAALQLLYSPDRVKGPMKRVGDRGAGQWEPVSWEEAIGTLASQLTALRERGVPHALALVLGESRGLMPDLFRRLARAFGTPNVIEGDDADPGGIALWLAQGVRGPAAYDLENARYILSFGVPLVDGWWAPVRQMRALADVRQGLPGRRGKLVQIEPRMSPTAARADEWIPVNPGTEGALALGIAHVLVADLLFDRRFVAERTLGFQDWTDADGHSHLGFRTLLVREYTPDAVAEITGVPAETVRRLAHEFAAYGPGLALGPRIGHERAIETALAIHAVNALAGRIDRPGGVLVPRSAPSPSWSDAEPDPVASRGLAMPRLDGAGEEFPVAESSLRGLTSALGSGEPYPVQALLLWRANPGFAQPSPRRFLEALAQVPFVASFSSFLDETTQYADLVLPEHVFPEGWQHVPPPPGLPYPVVTFAQPAVEPLHDTRHTGDVLIALAAALGGSVRQALPWADFQQVLTGVAEALYRSRRGMVFIRHEEVFPPRPLRELEWAPPPYASFDEFYEELIANGGWTDPSYRYGDWGRVIRTSSGKFEFYSQTLRRVVDARAEAEGLTVEALLDRLGWSVTDERAFLPHYEPPGVAVEPRYSRHLHAFRLLSLGDGRRANQPYLQEILGVEAGVQWNSWIELNPETAAELGIGDGEWVWVESPAGRARVRAKVYPGIMPGVVAMPEGQGHTALGRYAAGKGVNVMELIGTEVEPLSGAPVLTARVRVYKAQEAATQEAETHG
ncbi:MAG: molybdopterin-dependent oxidoreductase [Gemmatimonadetes bacterium]|nr:molybdopterin-dependent oxidoreductase [Gemmatimonadota bacterium]